MVSFTSVSSIAVALLTASSAINAQFAPQVQQFQQVSNFDQLGFPSAYSGYSTPQGQQQQQQQQQQPQQPQQPQQQQQQQQQQQSSFPQSEALNQLSQTFYNWAKATNIVNKNYQTVANEAMNDFKSAKGTIKQKMEAVNKKYQLQELAASLTPVAVKLAQEYKTNPAVQQAAASYLPKIQQMMSAVTAGSGSGGLLSMLGPLKSLLG